MNKDEVEYEVIVRTRDNEYEYDISVTKKVHENQMDNNESKKSDHNSVVNALICIPPIVTFLGIIIGIVFNIGIVILYGTLFSLIYGIFTSNFFKRYEKGFSRVTGTSLNNRPFVCKLSLGIGAVGFIISDVISNHMSEFINNGNELLTLSLNILMAISLIILLLDSNSRSDV